MLLPRRDNMAEQQHQQPMQVDANPVQGPQDNQIQRIPARDVSLVTKSGNGLNDQN